MYSFKKQMPIYEYACEECRKQYTQAPEKNTCYECGGLINKLSGLDTIIKTSTLEEELKESEINKNYLYKNLVEINIYK